MRRHEQPHRRPQEVQDQRRELKGARAQGHRERAGTDPPLGQQVEAWPKHPAEQPQAKLTGPRDEGQVKGSRTKRLHHRPRAKKTWQHDVQRVRQRREEKNSERGVAQQHEYGDAPCDRPSQVVARASSVKDR